MGAPQRVSSEAIITTYERTRSIWRTGKELGLAGQSVHDRLVSLGVERGLREWTAEEDSELGNLVREGMTLHEVAERLGRTYNAIAMRISRLGITKPGRGTKPKPRTLNPDEALQRLQQISRDTDRSFTQVCIANGWSIEMTSRSLERHNPILWEEYRASRSRLPRKSCSYCSKMFRPSTGKQRCCSRKCADDERVDRDYFGGKRRSTIGLDERQCQLCLRIIERQLSSHHVAGKDNDAENDYLVALCRGCHALVGALAAKSWIGNADRLDKLIQLSWLRAHGRDFIRQDGAGVRTYVEVEPVLTDDYGRETRWDLCDQ